MKLIFIILFLFTSCSEKAKLEVDRYKNYVVSSKKVYISDAAVEKWKVGPLRRQTISKGIRIGITFPPLGMSDLKTLIANTDVDSFIMRLRKRGSVGGRVLGYLYVPFLLRKGKTKSSLRTKIMTKGYFFVYYTAAAISGRFEQLSCPAFNHRFRIDDVEVSAHQGQEVKFTVSKSAIERVNAKVSPFEYKSVFNGGESLVGEYMVELAFFNYEKKERKSSWIELPERVVVESENEQFVKGCAESSLPPPLEDRGDPVKKFKFGQ